MKILIAGDFVPQNRVIPFIENGQYSEIFGEVKPVVESADYAIVNLEAPIITDNPTPIKKKGPNLFTSKSVIDAIKFAGFDCVTLANNHFYDQGEQGVRCTIEGCKTRGVDFVGGGYNIKEASKVLYKAINDKILAIINCCEREYSIASEEHGGSCPLDNIDQFYSIQEAKKNADYIVVIVHGGMEGCQLPPMHLVKTCRFFIDVGADIVVCHHQHCYSGFEKYHNKHIVYGLGNFCFDRMRKHDDIWSYGYMVSFQLQNQGNIKLDIIPYNQCSEVPAISLLKNEELKFFNKRIEELNSIIAEDEQLQQCLITIYEKNEKELYDITNVYHTKLFRKLYHHKFIPDLFPHQNWQLLYGRLICCTHRERFIHLATKQLNNCINK